MNYLLDNIYREYRFSMGDADIVFFSNHDSLSESPDTGLPHSHKLYELFHILEGSMTIPLQSDDKDHYVQFTVAFSLDTKGEGYKQYGGENMANYESVVKDAITKTVSKHTIEECRNDFDTIREEILVAVKALFDKEFIYKVAINEIKFQ